MSRFKRLEELELNLPHLSADELRIELEFWKSRTPVMYGRAVKPHMKRIYQLERALELKLRDESELTQD